MTPALTAEEWEQFTGDESWLAQIQVELGNRAGDLVEQRMRTGRTHAAAALALHGQAFGFTREHLAALRRISDGWRLYEDGRPEDRAVAESDGDALGEVIDRIKALLPPEPTP